ncbi:hypothetical protein PIB30_017156 [Stylosanthes scabra]|uniref:NmrA-like domain-containing protein n=1 Tax=Stylosanthes scabra TaxID=79078 RepID=A0ABU6W8Q2_9FABA|nr:hypothetical protein [Stylosanthes scabra]
MAGKSKVLVIGGTGHLGKYIVEASSKAGHPTFALVRESSVSDPQKSNLIDSFKSYGVTLIYGDLSDHASLVKAIKKVDVVICSVGPSQTDDQLNIINAIKEAGNIKKFLPSEFGVDVDRHKAVEPAASLFEKKVKIRRAIEAEGIPYTYLISNGFASYYLATMAQENATAPPKDKIVILGDGNVKAIYVDEKDIAAYTVKTVDDTRTLNKSVYLRPPENVLTFNELVSLWENKINKTLHKIYVPEDQILKTIQESSFPRNIILAVCHSLVVNGDCVNYDIEPSFGVEASELYPQVKYTTVDEYMSQFV